MMFTICLHLEIASRKEKSLTAVILFVCFYCFKAFFNCAESLHAHFVAFKVRGFKILYRTTVHDYKFSCCGCFNFYSFVHRILHDLPLSRGFVLRFSFPLSDTIITYIYYFVNRFLMMFTICLHFGICRFSLFRS